MVVVSLGDRSDTSALSACSEASEHPVPLGETLLQNIQDIHAMLGAYHTDVLRRLDTFEERFADPKFRLGSRPATMGPSEQDAKSNCGCSDCTVGQECIAEPRFRLERRPAMMTQSELDAKSSGGRSESNFGQDASPTRRSVISGADSSASRSHPASHPASPTLKAAARSLSSLLFTHRDKAKMMGTRESALRRGEALEAEEDRKRSERSICQEEGSHTTLGRIVASPQFEYVFAAAIFFSSILQGIEVEYASRCLGEPIPLPFTVLQYVCNALFIVELAMRLRAHGCRRFFALHKHWAVLDTLAVLFSLVEVAADTILMVASSNSQVSWSASNLRTFRMVRITRLVRAVRIQRIIRFVSSLRILVDSIVATLRSLIWAMVLLTLIIYVCAVTFTQAAADYAAVEDNTTVETVRFYWGDLYASMGTLFQAISGGESWRNCLLPLEEISPVLGIFLYMYIAFTYFAVLNVVTGVFCKSAIDTTQSNPEIVAQAMRSAREEQERQLKMLFSSLDTNHTGQITMGNLERLMHDPITQGYFSVLGLNVNDAWTLFKLLDTDGGGTIEVDEFLVGLAQLQGGARNLDVATIKYDLRLFARRVVYFISQMEGRFALSSGPSDGAG